MRGPLVGEALKVHGIGVVRGFFYCTIIPEKSSY
jgi:hypothetical protein